MSDITDDFLWKGFEQLHPTSEDTDDDVVAQMERMLEPKFRREYTVFRISHFASRIVELDDDFQLPTNSILHIADNLEHLDDFIDTPRVDENRFVQKESFRKWIYHVRELNDKGPIQYEDKYILRMAGLPGKLLAFRSEHGNEFRYVNHISELPRKKESLIIINHNPLFRMRMYGRLQFFRKMQQIFASILNTCCDLTFLNKRQFIFLPWGDEFYDRALFFRSRNVLNLATIKRPESLHYFLMMHILNFLWDTATTSMLKKLPEKVLEQLYIVPNIKGKYIFYNLKDLLNLNEKNYAYRRVTNQLNLLAVLGREGIDESHPQIKQLLEEAKVDEVVNEQPQESTQEDSEGTEVKETILPVSRLVPGIALDKKPKPVIEEDTARIEDEIKEAAAETKASEDPTRPTTTIKGVASSSKNPPITAVSIEVPSAQAEIKTSTKNVSKVVNTNLILNTTKLDISRAHKEDTTEYIRDTEQAADEFIDEQEELTPRAKEHFKKLARKYENLEIDGEKIKNILEDSSDNTLSDSTLNKEQLGVVPDESALVSTLANFDKDYIKKTYKKHIAGTITSFQKQGVYLINVKTEPVVTDLHNYTLYTCQYEDIQGRKSTVKFKMPNVTSEGKITVDGVPNIVKKQRTTLPIVKISDTVVSLASNYNKTRVIRNTNKAHNFFSYIHSFVNDKEKSNITVGYGTHRLNLAISYEYTALAERYSTLDYKGTDNRKYSLTFDYYHRFDKFSGKPELLEKLEAQYGTYFGTASGDWLFIDVNNRVYAVKTSGGEDSDYPYTSLIDVLKLGCKEDIASKIKPLSEWVTIKILDLNIPVIFMLAYRYGLRKTLDYLGMKYTITENRSKTIVGENTAIAGVESYTPRTPDSNIYFYHVIPKNNTLKQDGLLSPYAMYHHRRDLFNKHTVSNYKKRAAEYLHKDESSITDEDIMKYLDTEPKRKAFTSKALFFSFVPADKLQVTHDNKYVQDSEEYRISIEDTIKYSVGKPLIVVGETSLETTWDEVKRHYDDYCRQAIEGGKKPYQEYLYHYIRHIAVKFEDAIPAEVLQPVEAGTESFGADTDNLYINGSVTSGVLDDDYTGIDDLIVGTENLKRPVKPKLGDVTLFVTDKGNTGDYDGRRVQIRAFIFTVKLGRSVSVVRRIHNYDSQTFVTNDIKSVSRDLVDKASEYLRCSKRKISKARLEFIPADKSIPPKVAKIPILSPVEYKKMTSKLNIDENKVRPPQHGTASWDVGMEDISEDIKYTPQPNDIHIRFADRVLHFNRYPLAHSLIVAGLANFDLSKYEMSELETKDAYFRILVDKKLSTNYLKGIDSFYDLFVDNMTYSVLKMMHEPTNVRDLLIRSTVLLTTTDHVSASSGTNHRIRGYEQFAAILYNEMSREFASYQARRGKANVFSINPDAVYLRIIQNASMVPAVTPSPLEDLKLTDAMTYAGVGGRTGESFVIEDRRFDASDVGIISEATADSGKVGMNAQLTFNPDITSTLGLIQDKDPSERTPSQTWSIHALTFPFATNDD